MFAITQITKNLQRQGSLNVKEVNGKLDLWVILSREGAQLGSWTLRWFSDQKDERELKWFGQ